VGGNNDFQRSLKPHPERDFAVPYS